MLRILKGGAETWLGEEVTYNPHGINQLLLLKKQLAAQTQP